MGRTTMRRAGVVMCVMMVFLVVSVAFAQGPQRGGRRGGMGGGFGGMGGMRGGFMRGGMGGGMNFMGLAGLLRIEQVQKEIKLTDEQKTKLEAYGKELMDSMRKEMQGFRPRGRNRDDSNEESQEERQKRMEKMRKEMTEKMAKFEKEAMTKLGEILSADQLKRVRQIQMQQAGVGVLASATIAEELSLTEDQKTQLKKIQEESSAEMGKMMREMWGGPRGRRGDRNRGGERDPQLAEKRKQNRQKMEQMRKDFDKKCMDVLTAEQKKKLVEMMGEPFELDRAALRRGRGGPDGRQRNGRRGRQRDGRQRPPQGEDAVQGVPI